MQERRPDKFSKLLADMVYRNEEDISMAEAALYIAGEQYPDLDVAEYLTKLDELGNDADQYIGARDDPARVLQRVSEYLSVRQGFHGNRDDYYDPENSYLNRVLDRKVGIPITLSIVYMEVGLRLGLVLEGIGLPGHFILRHGPPEWELYVDPFDGRLLSRADCEQIVFSMFQEGAEFHEEYLRPYTRKQTLVRVLTNLKLIYREQGDYPRAIAAANNIDMIEPGLGGNLVERAWLQGQLGHYRLAITDLELYLKTTPQPEDAEDVRGQIQALWQIIATLN